MKLGNISTITLTVVALLGGLALSGCASSSTPDASSSSIAPSPLASATSTAQDRQAHGMWRYARICFSVTGDLGDSLYVAPGIVTDGAFTSIDVGDEPACFEGTTTDAMSLVSMRLGGTSTYLRVGAKNEWNYWPKFFFCRDRGKGKVDECDNIQNTDSANYSVNEQHSITWDSMRVTATRLADTEWKEFKVEVAPAKR